MRTRISGRSARRSGRPPAWAVVGMTTCLAALAATCPWWLRPGGTEPTAAATAAMPAPLAPATPFGLPVERPTDRNLRVLFIGDSLMWGSFASDESLTYRARIVTTLSAGGPVDAVTVGGPGESAAEATKHLSRVSGPFDLVFVEVGANDSVALTPATFSADYTALLDEVRAVTPQAGLICDGVWNGPRFAAQLDRELRPVCAAHDGIVVPLSDLYVDETLRGPAGSRVPGGAVRDQFHPNDAGHAAIATAMLAVLDY
jgi:acyl-CoA thioesterase-1